MHITGALGQRSGPFCCHMPKGAYGWIHHMAPLFTMARWSRRYNRY